MADITGIKEISETFNRSEGMKQIIFELTNRQINLNHLTALEMFARKGNWQAHVYADKVRSLDAWEIEKNFEVELKQNLPKANVMIVDSIQKIKNENYSSLKKYDLIVIDNGQNCYGENRKYCEHFDVLPHINKLISDTSIVVFNVNKNPINYEKYLDWKQRRDEFYQMNTKNMDIGDLFYFYKQFFFRQGLSTQFYFNVNREKNSNIDYLHYFVFQLRRSDLKL